MAVSGPSLMDQFNGLGDELLDESLKQLRSHAPSQSGSLARSFRRRGRREIVSDLPYAAEVDRRAPFVDRALDAAKRSFERG